MYMYIIILVLKVFIMQSCDPSQKMSLKLLHLYYPPKTVLKHPPPLSKCLSSGSQFRGYMFVLKRPVLNTDSFKGVRHSKKCMYLGGSQPLEKVIPVQFFKL